MKKLKRLWLFVATLPLRRIKLTASTLRRDLERFPDWRDAREDLDELLEKQGLPAAPEIGDEFVFCAHMIPYELGAAAEDYLRWKGWEAGQSFGGLSGYGSYLYYGYVPKNEKLPS